MTILNDVLNATAANNNTAGTDSNPFRAVAQDDGGCAQLAVINGICRMVAVGSAWHECSWEFDPTEECPTMTVEAIQTLAPQLVAEIRHESPTIELDGQTVIVPNTLAAVATFGDGAEVLLDGFRADERRPIFQPSDTLQMLEDALKIHGSGELSSFGFLHGGTCFFASAKMGSADFGGCDIVDRFWNVTDGFTGRWAFTMSLNTFRAVCNNTATAARNGAAKIKHTANATDRVASMVRQLTGLENAYQKREETMRQMAATDVDPEAYIRELANAVSDRLKIATGLDRIGNLDESDFDGPKAYASAITGLQRKIDRRTLLIDSVLEAYHSDRNPSNLWGAYNAATEVATHGGPIGSDAEFFKTRKTDKSNAADRSLLAQIGLGGGAVDQREELKEAAFETAEAFLTR